MSKMRVSRRAGHWGAVVGLLVAGLFLTGCKSASTDPRFSQVPGFTGVPAGQSGIASSAGTPAQTGNIGSDYIHAGDTLLITFADLAIQVQSPVEERVKEDGTIGLLENQTFIAAGKTYGQLGKEIHDRYVPDYYKKMTVSVRPKTETQFYYVDGEVKLPNRQVYISRTTVLKAIASAGGFTDFANKGHVTLTRVDGRRFIINCKKAIKDPRLDLEVLPGDKVWVPRRII